MSYTVSEPRPLVLSEVQPTDDDLRVYNFMIEQLDKESWTVDGRMLAIRSRTVTHDEYISLISDISQWNPVSVGFYRIINTSLPSYCKFRLLQDDSNPLIYHLGITQYAS